MVGDLVLDLDLDLDLDQVLDLDLDGLGVSAIQLEEVALMRQWPWEGVTGTLLGLHGGMKCCW